VASDAGHEIALIRYRDALGVGLRRRPGWSTEDVARDIARGEAAGHIETRLVLGPTLGVPPYGSEKFYVFSSVHRWFSPMPLPEDAPAEPAPVKPKRRRGFDPEVTPRVVAEMRADMARGMDLDAMKDEEMAARYKASRPTCTKARDIVLCRTLQD
jgi:hypothetical protein